MSVVQLGKYDFIVRKGDTLRRSVGFSGTGFEPTDITGFDAELIAKDIDTGEVLLTMTTANGKILVDGPALRLWLVLTNVETDAIDWTRAEHTIKLIDTPGTGDHTTYLTGVICVV